MEVRVGGVEDEVGIVGFEVRAVVVGVIGVRFVVVGFVEEVGVIVDSKEGSGVDSSCVFCMIFGVSSPFFTRISIDGNIVGQEALMPCGLLHWARAFALLKHQFCEPGFQV